ncbi:MAG TPA: TetR/AcrR family transcriptional regulator [Acidimicrobiales bacterium]
MSARRAAESTRDRILAEALDLFVEQGIDRTSLREIAERIGITKAALYYHFPSKDDLLAAVFKPVVDVHQRALDHLEGPVDRVTWARGVLDLFDWISENPKVFALFDQYHEKLHDKIHAEEHRAIHARLDDRLDELFRRTDRTVDETVRMAAALGAAAGVVKAAAYLEGADPEEVRAATRRVVAQVLEVDVDDLEPTNTDATGAIGKAAASPR